MLAIALIVPQVTLAAWWNPFSWGIWNRIFHFQRQVQNPVACTMEAKLCPDGSSVGRTGPKCEFAECPKVNKEKACTDSGGKISKATCYCSGTQDFYNSCLIGACTCTPDPKYKKELKICDCGNGKCWDGTKCTDLSPANDTTPPTDQTAGWKTYKTASFEIKYPADLNIKIRAVKEVGPASLFGIDIDKNPQDNIYAPVFFRLIMEGSDFVFGTRDWQNYKIGQINGNLACSGTCELVFASGSNQKFYIQTQKNPKTDIITEKILLSLKLFDAERDSFIKSRLMLLTNFESEYFIGDDSGKWCSIQKYYNLKKSVTDQYPDINLVCTCETSNCLNTNKWCVSAKLSSQNYYCIDSGAQRIESDNSNICTAGVCKK